MASSPPSDTALVTACLAGDRRAWEGLVRRYERLIYSLPVRAGLQDEEAAGVFRATCLRLLENLEQLKYEETLLDWLLTTGREETTLRVRQLRRQSPEAAGSLAEEPLPAEDLTSLRRQHLIRRAMDRLDRRCRHLIELAYPPAESAAARPARVASTASLPELAQCLARLQQLVEAGEE
jgi:RNA polymerase sigma factor (sigma-70 family)